MSAGMRCTRSKDPGEKKRGEKEKEEEKERGRRTRNSSYCRRNSSAEEADTCDSQPHHLTSPIPRRTICVRSLISSGYREITQPATERCASSVCFQVVGTSQKISDTR